MLSDEVRVTNKNYNLAMSGLIEFSVYNINIFYPEA